MLLSTARARPRRPAPRPLRLPARADVGARRRRSGSRSSCAPGRSGRSVSSSLVLVVAAVTRPSERRRLRGATAVVAAIAILVPAPWYAHQLSRYDSALFGQPQPREPRLVAPPARVLRRRRAAGGRHGPVPAVVLASVRPDRLRRGLGRLLRRLAVVPDRGAPTAGVRRELVTMSIVGLPFTLLAARRLARAPRPRGPPSRARPPSASSSPSFRSPPSPAPLYFATATRRPTGTR